jgi:hypothetical protein
VLQDLADDVGALNEGDHPASNGSIEAHVKMGVLALLIECNAELQSGKPWHQNRLALERLQVTEFFGLNRRVLMCNEIPSEIHKVYNMLKISPSQAGRRTGRTSPNLYIHAESRSFCNLQNGLCLR